MNLSLRCMLIGLIAVTAGCAKAPTEPAALSSKATRPGNARAVSAQGGFVQAQARGGFAGLSPSGMAVWSPTSAERRGSARTGFADAPDHGELVNYQAAGKRRDGAYIWHRVGVSEAHAVQAIASGAMRITTPSGQLLHFIYDRHVEHASGDWTWVGHLQGKPGENIVLTFGSAAAYGSIAQTSGLPLRLTTRENVSWMVETDPRQLARIDNAATRPMRQDFLVPPKAAQHSTGGYSSPVPATTMAPTSASTTVDVVLGYTKGFEAAHGGTSGAVTRLNYLLEIANVSYANSQLGGRARLVATVAVDYPDPTSNDSALEALTGYDGENNRQIPVPAAFTALRAARDTYGADLVSLVRKFQDPENDGCGLAWLLGGGRTGIDAGDASFGYSVVSDGTDQGSDGKTYYCLDETLAHELGHGMGAAHDVDTANGDNNTLESGEYGAYSYSFGYKSTAYNFSTVMAYGDRGQKAFRVFSSPRVGICGAPCGTDQADNARTLMQTMPLVAAFRATRVTTTPPPPPTPRGLLHQIDANGNGVSDLFFRNVTDGRIVVWYMSGTARTAISNVATGTGSYRLIDSADMTADGRGDLMYGNGNALAASYSTGSGFNTQTVPYTVAAGWSALGLADINGNRTADLVLRNTSSGAGSLWFFIGATRTAYASFSVPVSYAYVGAGDLTGDGRDDLVWTDAGGRVLVSISTGSALGNASVANVYDTRFSLIGLSDANGDSYADLLFWNPGTRQVVVWLMRGMTRIGYFSWLAPAGYTPAGRGDFNGDGRGDLVWRNASYRIAIAFNTGASYTFAVLPDGYSAGWALMGRE